MCHWMGMGSVKFNCFYPHQKCYNYNVSASVMLPLKKNVYISTIFDGMFVNVYGKQMYQNVYSVVVK